jgi:hypothetical protein
VAEVVATGAGAWAGVAGFVTVADVTFVVTLGAPVELVVGPEAAVAVAVAVGAGDSFAVAVGVAGVVTDAAGAVAGVEFAADAAVRGEEVVLPAETAGVADGPLEAVVTAGAPAAAVLPCVTVIASGFAAVAAD